MYQPVKEVEILRNLKVDIMAEVSGSHETMKNNALIACSRHNEAIDLLIGEGNYKDSWKQDCQISPLKFQIAMDDLSVELRSTQSPYSLPNKEMVRHRLGLISQVDTNHPLSKHWRISRDRCFAPGQDLEDWNELYTEPRNSDVA